ncbi:MAG: DUF2993 domain-containing protein [Synechococcales cyanobacterium C42_A2020_086]|jgi:hypothetical protein|nr:DUF2993 domain-containing protein [Synechococcales cyanobacterium C42_A2020_086]
MLGQPDPSDFSLSDHHPEAGGQLISRVLSPAVRLWLRSQVESVARLEVQIQGSNRQILQGRIPQVAVIAQQVVYQGLHLHHLELAAEQIHVNLGQVVKGKPLRLMEIVPVSGVLRLQQSDLNASVSAPLLANALTEVVLLLLRQAPNPLPKEIAAALQTSDLRIEHPQIQLATQQLLFNAYLSTPVRRLPVVLQTQVQLVGGARIQLLQPQLCQNDGPNSCCLVALNQVEIDLGPEVVIQELILEPGHLSCRGKANVIPA